MQNDFHGNTLTDCGTAGLGGCRYTNLVMATWGNSQNQFTVPFTPVANAGVTNDYITSPLFVTPYLYYPQIGEQGVNAQTNILYVKNPGDSIPYYYILVNQNAPINTPPSGVSSGLCLFRTNNINDPNSWVGWDGSAFTVKFNVNPYVTPIANPKNCAYVLPSPFRYSLSYDPQYKTFIAMGVASVQPDPPLSTQKSQSQVIYATTQDLTDWGHYPKPTNYIYPPSAVMWNYNGGVNPSYVLYQLWSASLGNDSFDAQGYFGLIDPTSSSISRAYFGQSDNNFQFVGSNPYLYMVYFHAKINPPLEFGQTMKDVDRLPLTITCTANCAGY